MYGRIHWKWILKEKEKMCDWSHLVQESGTWPSIVANFGFRKGHRVTILSSIKVFLQKRVS